MSKFKFLSACALAIGTMGLAPAAIAAEGDVITDAREIAPDGLIGIWKADMEASSYGHAKPQAAYRTFYYTEDGKILVSFQTLGATGNISFGHWAAQLDGTPGIEYHSSAKSVPYNVVSWQPGEDGRLYLDVSRHGETYIKAIYELSADKQTLKYSYGDTTVVYRRWNLKD